MSACEQENLVNQFAEFIPGDGGDQMPAVLIRGTYVWVYYENGQLCVGVGREEALTPPAVRVTVDGHGVVLDEVTP